MAPRKDERRMMGVYQKMPDVTQPGVVAEVAVQQEPEIVVEGEIITPEPAVEKEAPTPAPKAEEKPTERTFTEPEVQSMIRERVKKAKESEELVKELVDSGYGSPTEIREALRKEREAKERQAIQGAGISDPDALDRIIKDRLAADPAIQEARQFSQTLKVQNEIAGLLSYLKGKGFPEATDDEVKAAYEKKSEGLSLKGAYLELYSDKLETTLRKRAQERQEDSDKHGTESSGGAPIREARERITVTSDEKAWAEDAVARGVFKTQIEAVKALKATREERDARRGK